MFWFLDLTQTYIYIYRIYSIIKLCLLHVSHVAFAECVQLFENLFLTLQQSIKKTIVNFVCIQNTHFKKKLKFLVLVLWCVALANLTLFASCIHFYYNVYLYIV